MNWRKLEAAVDRKVGGAFGERVRLSFMDGGSADAARPQITVSCIALAIGADEARQLGERNRLHSRVDAGDAVLFLDRTTYHGPPVRAGDRVRAMDRDNTPVWEVAGTGDRESNLIVLLLKQL